MKEGMHCVKLVALIAHEPKQRTTVTNKALVGLMQWMYLRRWTLAGVIVGIAVGAGLYGSKPSAGAIELIGEHVTLSVTEHKLATMAKRRHPYTCLLDDKLIFHVHFKLVHSMATDHQNRHYLLVWPCFLHYLQGTISTNIVATEAADYWLTREVISFKCINISATNQWPVTNQSDILLTLDIHMVEMLSFTIPSAHINSRCAGYPGELMLSALKELVLPLIAFALMTGVLNLRHTRVG